MVAESTGSGASGAGGRALSRSPRGPVPWRGGAPGPGLGDIPELLTPSPVGRGPRSQEAPTPPAGPPLPSPSPKPEAPARGYGPLRSSEKQRDAAAAAAGPRGLRARPLLSPPRLPQGRRARGRDARLPGRGQGPGSGSDATRFPGVLGDGLPPCPGPAPVIGALRLPGRPTGSGPGWRRHPPLLRPLPHQACWRGAIPPPGRHRTPPRTRVRLPKASQARLYAPPALWVRPNPLSGPEARSYPPTGA